jgi:hypothetical protein
MTIHRSHWTAAAIAALVAGTGLACARQSAPKSPPTATAPAPAAHAANAPKTNAPPPGAARPGQPSDGQGAQGNGEDDAELVVSRDVVARCPTLRLVREHMSELDQDMIWLAVLESIAECMSDGGPMAQENIGVSGDEDHRHIVREVLGTHDIAPTRVVATPQSAVGTAECQGGSNCAQRVEITIESP